MFGLGTANVEDTQDNGFLGYESKKAFGLKVNVKVVRCMPKKATCGIGWGMPPRSETKSTVPLGHSTPCQTTPSILLQTPKTPPSIYGNPPNIGPKQPKMHVIR